MSCPGSGLSLKPSKSLPTKENTKPSARPRSCYEPETENDRSPTAAPSRRVEGDQNVSSFGRPRQGRRHGPRYALLLSQLPHVWTGRDVARPYGGHPHGGHCSFTVPERECSGDRRPGRAQHGSLG